MKKYLALASAFACVGLMTACHDSDDEEGNVAGDFSSGVSVMSMPAKLNMLTDNAGVTSYLLSDGNICLFTYVTGTSDNNPIYNLFNGSWVAEGDSTTDNTVAVEKSSIELADYKKIYSDDTNSWYGGFLPTWQAAEDEDAYDMITPIDGTYNNEINCLVANPGTVCRALFTKSLTSPMAYLTMKKSHSCRIQAPVIYKYMYDALKGDETGKSNIDAWGISLLPANTRIEAVVYGYVESFGITKIADALTALKNAGQNLAAGGTQVGAVTLIETDANGKPTTLCETWADVEFSKGTYLNEIYLRAVDTTTGKTSAAVSFDSGSAYELLNYVLVDKITYEGRSLF